MHRLAFLVFIMLPGVGCGHRHAPTTYRFVVANDQLFAFEEGHSFGTTQRVLATDDLGEHWKTFEVPDKTHALAGSGNALFALTSRGTLWRKGPESEAWSRFDQKSNPKEFTYSIAADSKGRVVTAGARAVTLYDDSGAVLGSFDSGNSDILFINAVFAGPKQEYVVVEANPFSVFVIDIGGNEMQPWTAGFSRQIPPGLSGACRVRRHGKQFLASRPEGIYFAPGLFQPWQMLADNTRHDAALGGNFCRDLVSHESGEDQWLVAKNSGIHLMQGAVERKLVFSDIEDDHDLILSIVPFRQHYFVSFSRLDNGCMGVRLPHDLSSGQPLYQPTPSSQPNRL